MVVTKHFATHGKKYRRRLIKYILNPDKTDNFKLVSAFGMSNYLDFPSYEEMVEMYNVNFTNNDRYYVSEKGTDTVKRHAADFVKKRLAPAVIPNDGKQTPMRGHPVFVAQHATATCCRGCLEKWHHIPAGRELTELEQEYIVAVIMEWIQQQMSL